MSTSHALPRIPPVIRRLPVKTQLTGAEAKQRKLARKRKENIILWSVLGGIAFLSFIIFGLFGEMTAAVGLTGSQVKIGKPFTVTDSEGNKFEVALKDVVLLVVHDKRSSSEPANDKLLVSYSFKNLGPRKGSLTLMNGAVKTDKGRIYEVGDRMDMSKTGIEFIYTNDRIGETGVSAFFISVPKGEKPVELTFSAGGALCERGSEFSAKLPKTLTKWWEYHPNPNVPQGKFINLGVYNVEIIKDEKYLKTRIAEDTNYDRAAERAERNREKEDARIQDIVRRTMRK